VKKACVLAVLVAGLAACITMAPPPPSFDIENPPAAFSAELSLDDRLAVEDAWNALRRGQTEKATKIFARLGPENPFYFAGLGYASYVVDDLASAEERFLASIKAFPALILGHLGLGQVYQKANQPERAYREYLEVLKIDPNNARAAKEAEAIRAQMIEDLMTQAKNFAAQGNAEKSKESYLKALEYSPKLQEAHLALARIYLKEKNFEQASLHLTAANANDPKNQALLTDYADALFQAGQLSKSLDAYERLLEIDSKNKTAMDRAENLKNRLGVVELPSQYSAIPGLAQVAREDVAALIGAKFREVLDQANPQPPVIVDITTSWASRFIIKVAACGIMDVYSNHTFQPNKSITKAELAEILVRLIDFLKKRGVRLVEQIPLDRIKIADVPRESFYFLPIVQAISYQIVDLAPDKTFKPDQPVSGREAMKSLDILSGLIK